MPRAFPRLLPLLIAAALAAGPGRAEVGPNGIDQAGAYLAARQAAGQNDFAAAAAWHDRALLADPGNPVLLEGAVAAHLALGEITAAAQSGERLLQDGGKNQLAWLAVLARAAQAGDFAAILQGQAQGQTIGALIDRLIGAWAKVGTGKMSEALADFDAIIAEPGTGAFGLYHKALALAASGDFEGADKLLTSPEAQAVMGLRRAVLAHAQILSQLERNPEAVALIDRIIGTRPDATAADLRRRLAAGEPVPFTMAGNATEGLAEVFFTLATALNTEADQAYVLLYARTAAALRPDHVDALLMSAGILQDLGRHDLAGQVFGLVPDSAPAALSARIGQADALIRAADVPAAVALLQDLAASHPEVVEVQVALGDALRRNEACDAAIAAYSAAIALVPDPQSGNWPLWYKRAGCYVQLDLWPEAEADYAFGLTLAPDEPRLLNELGYTWVDRGENLEKALEMIQRAVAAAPDTGYIVDSLAWAYYRLGRFDEAVAPQEKAAELMPLDPIITDHLGDIYWMVGRKREAMFQWRRALSFEPEEKDKARILKKLDIGLDRVLEEEARGTDGN